MQVEHMDIIITKFEIYQFLSAQGLKINSVELIYDC